MRKLAIILSVVTLFAILVGVCGCPAWYKIRQVSTGGTIPTVITEVAAEGKSAPWAGAPPMPEIEPGHAESTSAKTGGLSHAVTSRSGLWILYPIGAAAVLAGVVVAVFFKAWKTGIALVVGGLGLVLAARFLENPVIVWILFLVALVGGVVWIVFATRAGKKIREALGFERRALDETMQGFQKAKEIAVAKKDVAVEEKDMRNAMNLGMMAKQSPEIQTELKRRKAELTV